MFGTLRYSSQNDDSEFVGRATDPSSLAPLDERGPRSLACDRCRSKKQRCSGQKNGCDRCKRNASVCNYSSSARRSKATDARSKSGSQAGSPPAAAAAHGSQSNYKGERQDNGSLRRPSKPSSSPQRQHAQSINETENMTDLFNPIASPFGSFDDDFTMTDQSLRDILPDYSCQSPDDRWDEITLPNLADIGDSQFSQPTHTKLAPTDPPLNPCPSFSDFDMDPYLTPPLTSPLTSLQPGITTTASDRAPSGQNFSMSALPRVQDDHNTALSHGSKSLPSSDDPPARCQCLRLIGVLLEDLERKNYLDDPAALDGILAWQKRALTQCSTVLSCSSCVARSEYILLLGLITERLASLCESTVSLHFKEVQRRSRFRTSSNGKHHSRTSSEESSTVFLGSYEIESNEEWSSLIRVLIVLQLRSLRSLLGDMKKAATTGTNATHVPMVQATERRVGGLIQKFRHPEPQLPGY